MNPGRFEKLVAEALDGIPRRFREAIHNVAVVVEDEPSVQRLMADALRPYPSWIRWGRW